MQDVCNKSKMAVVKLPLKELTKRLYHIYSDMDIVNNVIKLSLTESGYNDGFGLIILHSENIFIVINSNPSYESITMDYDPENETKFNKDNIEGYHFYDGSKFDNIDLSIISMAYHTQTESINKLLIRCIEEMLHK